MEHNCIRLSSARCLMRCTINTTRSDVDVADPCRVSRERMSPSCQRPRLGGDGSVLLYYFPSAMTLHGLFIIALVHSQLLDDPRTQIVSRFPPGTLHGFWSHMVLITVAPNLANIRRTLRTCALSLSGRRTKNTARCRRWESNPCSGRYIDKLDHCRRSSIICLKTTTCLPYENLFFCFNPPPDV